MSATQDLIAAALTAADELSNQDTLMLDRIAEGIREACARAMVQPVGEVPMPEPVGFIDRDDDNTWATLADNAYELSNLRIGSKVFAADQMRTYGDAREAAGYAAGVAAERERVCTAIKAEDDYCMTQGDYMLDSDDCIRIARGIWQRPEFAALRGEVKP